MKDFIALFAEQLIDEDVNLSKDTKFRDLEDWDSLTAMAVLTMIEDNYKVKISVEQFKKFITIEDLYNHISANKV